MTRTKTATSVVLRPRRQITLPKEVCDRLGIKPGDKLELTLEDSTLVARPKKAIALEALREIREAFRRAGVTEEELLEAGRQVREELAREKYGPKS